MKLSKIIIGFAVFVIFSGVLTLAFFEIGKKMQGENAIEYPRQMMGKTTILDDSTGFISREDAQKVLADLMGEESKLNSALIDDRFRMKVYWKFKGNRASYKVDATDGKLLNFLDFNLQDSSGIPVSDKSEIVEIAKGFLRKTDPELFEKEYNISVKFYGHGDATDEWFVNFQGYFQGVQVKPNHILVSINPENGKVYGYNNYWYQVDPRILKKVKVSKEKILKKEWYGDKPSNASLIIDFLGEDLAPIWQVEYPGGTAWYDVRNGKFLSEEREYIGNVVHVTHFDKAIYIENGTEYIVLRKFLRPFREANQISYTLAKHEDRLKFNRYEDIYDENLIGKTLEYPSFIFYRQSNITALLLLLKDENKEFYIKNRTLSRWIKYNTNFIFINFEKNSTHILNLTVKDVEGKLWNPPFFDAETGKWFGHINSTIINSKNNYNGSPNINYSERIFINFNETKNITLTPNHTAYSSLLEDFSIVIDSIDGLLKCPVPCNLTEENKDNKYLQGFFSSPRHLNITTNYGKYYNETADNFVIIFNEKYSKIIFLCQQNKFEGCSNRCGAWGHHATDVISRMNQTIDELRPLS